MRDRTSLGSGTRAALLGGVAIASLNWGTAQAADGTSAGSEKIETVIVTAEKRTEDLQKVPISAMAFSATDIQNLGFKTMDDIAQSVPNFQFSRLTTLSNELSIRGIASGDSEPGFETGIAVILDDVYIARAVGFDTTLMDIDSLAVLRGPQGTLQGRNVIGGAIIVNTARPSFEFSGQSEVDYGNYNLTDVRLSLNGPLIDDVVAGKISLAYRAHDGFGENTDLHAQLDTEDTQAVRAQLLIQPTSQLRILLTGDFNYDHNHDMHNGFGPPSATSLPPQTISREVGGDIRNRGHNEVYGGAVNVYYDLGDSISLTSVTSYRGYDTTDVQEGDGQKNFGAAGAGTFLATAENDQSQHQFSEELRVASDTGLNNPFYWLAGVSYYQDAIRNYQNFLAGFNTGTIVAGTSGISDATTTTKSSAVFGSATYNVGSFLGITGGFRYTTDRRGVAVSEVNGFDGIDPIYGMYTFEPTLANPTPKHFADSTYYPTTHNSLENDVLTGDFVVSENWTDDISTYVKYARGFKGGGFNTEFNYGASGQKVEPEYVDSYELGWRSELLDHRLQLNVTGYYTGHTNEQVQVFDPSTFTYVTSNEPSTRSYGVELDMKAVLSDTLSAGIALGTINSKVTKGPDEGLKVPYSSPLTATLTADYVQPIDHGWEIYFFPSASWRGEFYTDPGNSEIGRQQGYWWLSGRLGIRSTDGPWSFGLFGHNLTDQKVISSASNVPGLFSVAFLEEPRTYGVEARYRF